MEQVLEWIKNQKVLCAFVFLGILCASFLTLYVVEATAEEAYVCPKPEETITETTEDEIIVDIKGAVVNPGVYHVNEGMIVNDIITLAGGLTEDADTSNLNLSKKVTNEMVITVYTKDEVKDAEKQEAIVEETGNDEDGKKESTTDLVSINTATLEELMTLPGIGEAKGKTIIQYRESCGKFTKIEDLLNIKGIGDSVFAKLKDYITL